jgi:alanyl-tRNA synthetase
VNSDELRTMFLQFFQGKDHTVIPSASLVPKEDPTLLLTSAGMVQIKPYFLGEAVPPAPRLASCQKCFRTTDIDEVGDASHLTFFEMLGNFSVGDYFKKEAIAWAWEFVTEHLKLDTDRLWVTIFRDDDESFTLWRETGVPSEKIVRFGEEDNFWGPAGSSGPCGPCSEIHYDFRPNDPCGPDCGPNCGCGRFVELWNLVFTQYDQDEAGNRTPLPRPNIDTGLGLDRLVTIMNGKSSIYETDIFTGLLDTVTGLAGKRYGQNEDDDNAMRVVAEHGRAITFLIADGVLPANESRGYVLRRLLRRAALFGRRLGLEKPFLATLAETTIEKLGGTYPELKQRRELIVKAVMGEETRFSATLATGLELIDDILKDHPGLISGADAFRLYDTYGFPIEITKEIAARRGIGVDMDGFEREMERQRERARAAHKFDNAANGGDLKLDVSGTEFVGYHCLEQEAQIVRLLVEGRIVESVEAGQEASVVLDTSPFYAEKGGQVGDTGSITSIAGRFSVTDTVPVPPDVIVHKGTVIEGTLHAGDRVTAAVADDRRADIARNHTATHLLQAALRQVLGEHIQQRGSLVAPEHLRFDFSHLAAVTPDELLRVQRLVNDMIRQDYSVTAEETGYQEAVAGGAMALFDEKYGDTVRVMTIGEGVSAELCGGTHVGATGEIGLFVITSESSVGAGIRRIEAVTGRGAEGYVAERLEALVEIARRLESAAEPKEVVKKLDERLDDLYYVRGRLHAQETKSAEREAENLLEQAGSINGVTVLAARVNAAVGSQQVLRQIADYLRDKLGSAVIVLGAAVNDRPMFVASVTDDLVEKGYHAGNIIREVARVAGGGGGGKPNFAQAGGKDAAKLDAALGLVKGLVARGD